MSRDNEDIKITKSNWIFFTEWASTIGVFLICFGFLYNHITTLTCESQRRFELQEQRFNANEQRFNLQGERTDKLYEMFVEIVKEKK